MADPTFALKDYQRATLDAVRAWLTDTALSDDADTAFYRRTKRAYQPVEGLPSIPYACLRLPTGGGKTLIAAHVVGVAADAFLKVDAPCALWLVPSNAIREQTIKALRDRAHPYRAALAERFGENVRVMGVPEALYAKRPDYDGGAVIIVATLQSFRIEQTEGRKVYDPNGELMDHFSGLSETQAKRLERADGGAPIPSLCNVLKLRRPLVIVDEAHNARTPLSFATLARLDPSLILEMTATPADDSNVLHHVSAAELKAADMIKLPIILRGRADWKAVVAEAKAWLDHLSECAKREEAATGEFIRPVMLLQAQPNKGASAITVEVLKQALKDDFLIPDGEIAVATGSQWELEGVDLAARDCLVRYVITVQALREGWDCPNAYVLCSVAEQHGKTAVEQILGRVMRLPRARRKHDADLNQAYAFAATQSFNATAKALADGLVANGFERIEAEELVKPPRELPGFEEDGQRFESDPIPAGVDLESLAKTLMATTGGRVFVDTSTRKIVAKGHLTSIDAKTLALSTPATLAGLVAGLVKRAAPPAGPIIAAAQGFKVPALAVVRGGQMELFGREHFLDIPWKLEECDASAILNVFTPPSDRTDEAHVDVTEKGKLDVTFVQDLHEQLALSLGDRGWDYPSLVRWLDRRLSPTTKQRDVTQASAQRFIRAALDAMQERGKYTLDRLARLRFRLVDALSVLIERYRDERSKNAFESCLFGNQLEFRVSSELAITFDPDAYWPKSRYQGRIKFEKHLNPSVIGDMNSEEEACAIVIERHAKVKRWVRNLERMPTAFRLATSSDWFYPDFAAELADGRSLVVEYKGGQLVGSDDTAEKELVGAKWAKASAGRCVFVMAKDKDYDAVARAIS